MRRHTDETARRPVAAIDRVVIRLLAERAFDRAEGIVADPGPRIRLPSAPECGGLLDPVGQRRILGHGPRKRAIANALGGIAVKSALAAPWRNHGDHALTLEQRGAIAFRQPDDTKVGGIRNRGAGRRTTVARRIHGRTTVGHAFDVESFRCVPQIAHPDRLHAKLGVGRAVEVEIDGVAIDLDDCLDVAQRADLFE
jgi:hypothetical protein